MAQQTVAIALVQLLVLAIEMEPSPNSCLCTERVVETKINLKSSCKQENWKKIMLLFQALSPFPIPTSFPEELTCALRRSFICSSAFILLYKAGHGP